MRGASLLSVSDFLCTLAVLISIILLASWFGHVSVASAATG